VPTARKKSNTRNARPRNAKKAEDALLFALSTLVLILFALLVSLILTVKYAPGPSEAAIPASREEAPPEANEAPAGLEAPESQDAVPEEGLMAQPEEGVPAHSPRPRSNPKKTQERKNMPRREGAQRTVAAPPERLEKGDIVIVIDDVGQNVWQLKPFLAFPGPITFAILPGLPCTVEARDMISAAGKDYIIHQPMEALDKLDPGPGALYVNMEDAKIQEILKKNYAELPGAKGMNNHMGSIATKNLNLMRQVMRFCRSRRLIFLDSRTIGGTATAEAGRLEKAAYGERDVFLDNSPEKENITAMFRDGQKIAEKHGRAVMIGHVWSAELAQTLMELYPELVNEGYSLSTISKIMVGDDDVDPGY
jgi:polysaccharide deacetylase 2 family uncharacterized protein YibQ